MLQLDQHIVIRIGREDLKTGYSLLPNLNEEELPQWYGYVRDLPRAMEAQKLPDAEELRHLNPGLADGTSVRAERVYKRDVRAEYATHAAKIDSVEKGQAVLMVGNGNAVNNLGIIAGESSDSGQFRLLRCAWEERRIEKRWRYSCLYVTKDNAIGIRDFSFCGGSPEPNVGVKWLTSGQRILRNGEITKSRDVLSETYDIRHVLRNRTTVGSEAEKSCSLETEPAVHEPVDERILQRVAGGGAVDVEGGRRRHGIRG